MWRVGSQEEACWKQGPEVELSRAGGKDPGAWLCDLWEDLMSCLLSLPLVSWAFLAWGPDRTLRIL